MSAPWTVPQVDFGQTEVYKSCTLLHVLIWPTRIDFVRRFFTRIKLVLMSDKGGFEY